MLEQKILIVIVNYRTATMVVDCLRSLAPERDALPGLKVTVVDSASGDDSVPVLERAIDANRWGAWVELIPAAENGGFAAGNNVGIAPALASGDAPDFIMLLNPDTIVRPGAIKILAQYLVDHPQVGIVASRLEHLDGEPQRSAFRFYSWISELENGLRLGVVSKLLSRWNTAPPISDQTKATDWACGASLLVRREVFESIGLLDDGFFMYFEEADFCLRANRAGWPCVYEPNARIVHLVGRSPGGQPGKSPARARPKYWFESRQRYFLKNYGLAYTALCNLLWGSGYALYRARSFLFRRNNADAPRFADFLRYTLSPGSWVVPKTSRLPQARQARQPESISASR